MRSQNSLNTCISILIILITRLLVSGEAQNVPTAFKVYGAVISKTTKKKLNELKKTKIFFSKI